LFKTTKGKATGKGREEERISKIREFRDMAKDRKWKRRDREF
jgi:hypothetical protein